MNLYKFLVRVSGKEILLNSIWTLDDCVGEKHGARILVVQIGQKD